MSDTLLIAPPRAVEALETRRVRWRRPPEWLWAAQMVLQVLSALALTTYSYFFIDDWLFLNQARTQAFGLSYLREPLYEHFSPVSRVLDKLLVHVAPASFGFAHGVQLALYALALVAFAFLVRTLIGNRWLAFGLTIAFGQALFLIRLMTWWTATGNILPSTIFTLVSLGAYVRWRRGRAWPWLGLSLLSFAGALLDYETGLVVPAYALALLFVLERDVRPRTLVAVLWRERWAWIGFAVMEGAALWNFYAYYYMPVRHPSAGQLVRYLWLSLAETFVPALFGVKAPESGLGGHAAVIAVCCVIAVALVALVVWLRPRAWRSLAAFAAVFLITMVPLGLNRIVVTGMSISRELYYQQSLQFMFLALAGLALVGGARRPVPARLVLASQRARAVAGGLAVIAAAAYATLFVTSVHAMDHAYPWPQFSRDYFSALKSSLRRAGPAPVLIDQTVPEGVIPAIFAPYNHFDELFPLIDRRLRFDVVAPRLYAGSADGHLVPVSFRPLAAARLNAATVSAMDGTGSRPAVRAHGGAACVPAGSTLTRLNLPLSAATATAAAGLPYALEASVSTIAGAKPTVVLIGAGGVAGSVAVPTAWPTGDSRVIVPLALGARVREVGLVLPPAACVRSLSLGRFAAAGRAL